MKPAIKRVFSGALLQLTGIVLCCNAHAQNAGQPASKSPSDRVVTVEECEGGSCGIWKFSGRIGAGTWPTGEEAILELESMTDDKIVIRRTDLKGSKEGLTAKYTGTRDEIGVGGTYTSSWQGISKSGHWSWEWTLSEQNPLGPPSVMHWCAMNFNCFTLNWDNGHYVAMDNGHPHGSIWTVESFTPKSVVMHRTEPGATAIVTGQISSDGNSIVNGQITWTSGPTGTFAFRASWGAALNTLPGSNAEAAARGSQPLRPDLMTTIKDFNTLVEAWKNLQYLFGGTR